MLRQLMTTASGAILALGLAAAPASALIIDVIDASSDASLPGWEADGEAFKWVGWPNYRMDEIALPYANPLNRIHVSPPAITAISGSGVDLAAVSAAELFTGGSPANEPSVNFIETVTEAVAEPASIAFVGAGLLGLAGARRRGKAKA